MMEMTTNGLETVRRLDVIWLQNDFRSLISSSHTPNSPFNRSDELEVFNLQRRALNAAVPAGESLLLCFSWLLRQRLISLSRRLNENKDVVQLSL